MTVGRKLQRGRQQTMTWGRLGCFRGLVGESIFEEVTLSRNREEVRDSDLSTWGKGILGRGGGESKGPESDELDLFGEW